MSNLGQLLEIWLRLNQCMAIPFSKLERPNKALVAQGQHYKYESCLHLESEPYIHHKHFK